MARPIAPSSSIIAASTERSASSACGGGSPGEPAEVGVLYSLMMSFPSARGWSVRGCSVGEVLLREPLQIVPDRSLRAGAAQAVGRMVGDDQLGAAPAVRLAAHAADRALQLQQQL